MQYYSNSNDILKIHHDLVVFIASVLKMKGCVHDCCFPASWKMRLSKLFVFCKNKKIGKGYLILPFDRCSMPNKESGRGSSFANEVVNVVHLIKRNKPRLRQSS